MPCADHQPKSEKKCVSCFAADILALTLSDEVSDMEEKLLDHKLRPLASWYEGLKKNLGKNDAEYCSNVIFNLNARLVARKHALFGSAQAQFIQPNAIQPQHRKRYRDRLRQMGTWIGFTEFTILADLFRVHFWIAVPSGQRWRRWEVGSAQDTNINNPALRWTGNHYEVATLTQYMNTDEYTVSNVIETNPRGDCGLESFLFLLIQPFVVVNPSGFNGAKAQRVLQLFRAAEGRPRVNNVISAQDEDYIAAISKLRELVASEMTDAQVNDAIIAEGVLPGENKDKAEEGTKGTTSGSTFNQGKNDAWIKYRDEFVLNFTLAKTVVRTTQDKMTCVANIGAAADWLKAAQKLESYEGWPDIRKDGLKAYVPKGVGTLTHTGLMVAEIAATNGPFLFVCAASNYHQSLVDDDTPWILKNSNQKLGQGKDMHTERFCLIQLYEWITTQKIVPTRIDIIWFLEKDMCEDGCVPVLKLFREYWDAKGVKVDDDIRSVSLLDDSYFQKNLGHSLKRFTLL